MKKQIIALIFAIFTIPIFANPIAPPPIISEIYWDENGWQMELVFDEMFGFFENMDQISLVYNEDTSAFVSGIPIVFDQPMVVDINDLVDPIEILIDGGVVDILETEGMIPLSFPLFYGNHVSSNITPVTYGQSIVCQRFYHYGSQDYTYWLVKETQPTIGESPFSCQTRSEFSGIVLDKLLRPFPDANIVYTDNNIEGYSPSIPGLVTDENGEFATDQMFCTEYQIRIIIDGQLELQTALNVEPDSSNYYEFMLDSLYVGINEDVPVEPHVLMSANPNPFNGRLDINIKVDNGKPIKSAELKLLDLHGNTLKSTTINSPYLVDADIHWVYMREIVMSSGVYILVLEADGKILASQKVIYQK